MAIIVTREMSQPEYMNHVLGKPIQKLSAYTKEKQHKIPKQNDNKINLKEADVLKLVKAELQRAKIFYKRLDTNGKIMWGKGEGRLVPTDMKGMPDVIAIYEGQFIAIEVKRKTGNVSQSQLNTLHDIIAAGGKACLCVNAERLVPFIKNLLTANEIRYYKNVPLI